VTSTTIQTERPLIEDRTCWKAVKPRAKCFGMCDPAVPIEICEGLDDHKADIVRVRLWTDQRLL
jgi:hypothetical protein